MKIKYIFVIILLTLPLQGVFSQRSDFELGIRQLKLGNTYREAGDYDKALEYIEEGMREAGKHSVYWRGVGYEYLGLLYKDIAYRNVDKKQMLSKANENFQAALTIYNKILTQPDGSQVAVAMIKKNINDINEELLNLARSETYAETGGYYDGSEILNYDNLKLRVLPGDIQEKVKNLSLANNKFRDFPAGIYRFKQLKYLNMNDNKIKELSMGIAELRNLEYLNLSNNRIKELPLDLGEMKQLKILDLSGNRLETLPATMCDMQNLRLLDLKDNKLEISSIMQLVKCLPNANILFDEYERVDKSTSSELQQLLEGGEFEIE